ncbi:endonuclease [Spiroplasma eriocheiris]|uniref:Endonuclease I n=1 Tax=Spiroplasma eriocheiris TaxID=315358 RepID=A0A0H3XIG1_9MOLU|nr:endonuclease [Spiroplasma eriocheiris]AHF58236.1 putative endonuclease I [Spiroplasma eriocheiris CCTCC M 207170]AKM54673.1 endonuclease I [Spiroplasma eriocheiris]
MKSILKLLFSFTIATPIPLNIISCYPTINHDDKSTINVELDPYLYQYYTPINNLGGSSLIKTLANLITTTQHPITYKEVWTVFNAAYQDKFYKKDNSIIDVYSTVFHGESPYTYQPQKDQCHGQPVSGEGTCYNREHIIPQSLFKKRMPMVADAYHILPSDAFVNNKRADYPHDVVVTATFRSKNGSKYGTNANGETVFEPTNDFKGIVARSYLYFAIRYYNQIPNNWGWIKHSYPFINEHYLTTYLNWANNYHPQEFEIYSNNIISKYQHNRNPFVDLPILTSLIWDPAFQNEQLHLIEKRTKN